MVSSKKRPVRALTIAINTANSATTIMIVRIRKRVGGIGIPCERHQPFVAFASRIVTIGDRPGIRPTETSSARSNMSRPREAENRERPNSAQSSNASSNSADQFQPAKSQQTAPTWRDFPGSREAGSHQLQGIGPYNGRRFGPAFASGRSKTETASLQPGSRSTASNPASSAALRPSRAESGEIRGHDKLLLALSKAQTLKTRLAFSLKTS